MTHRAPKARAATAIAAVALTAACPAPPRATHGGSTSTESAAPEQQAAAATAPREPETAPNGAHPREPGPKAPDALDALVASCSQLALSDQADPNRNLEGAALACDELGGKLAAALPRLVERCQKKDDASACVLVGAAHQQARMIALSVELLSPPCRKQAGDCHGHTRRMLAVPFAGPSRDDAAAERSLARACGLEHVDACVELALLIEKRDRIRAAELYRKACHAERAAACADAVYFGRVSSDVVDPALYRQAAAVFARRCDAGSSAACNNLGFLVERRLAEPGGPAPAAAHYRKACAAGGAVGCANLVFLAEQHTEVRRKPELGDATATLERGCAGKESDVGPTLCLAHAFSLRLGGKANPRKATELLRKLCKEGNGDACRATSAGSPR